jgi:ADP-heptose:LPS heptosyltransferase
LLVTELWGLGDLALAMPFLRAASDLRPVTLVARPHASALLARFAPGVELVGLVAPWTAFRGKYRLHRWPWAGLAGVLRGLRSRRFGAAATARPDPRDHLLLRLSGARRRLGFPRAGSSLLLTDPLPRPLDPHRACHWEALAGALGFSAAAKAPPPRNGRRILIHTGAGQAVRRWPRERFNELSAALQRSGWQTETIDDSFSGIERLLDKLDAADRFIGNDSGPGHLAALLGVPTFTIFGPQLPGLFSPRHPRAAWIEGAPCRYKPCSDNCRFDEARCLTGLGAEAVLARILPWLKE